MKVLVAIKRVIDPYVRIRVQPDQSGVETQNVKMTMNPFDEIALEEAVRLREQGKVKEVVAVSIGTDASQETLRSALALGADRAIFVKTGSAHCSLNIAKILQQLVINENPMLVLMGKQSIDGDNNQTPQMLAALLNWPQATFASKIVLNEKQVEVTRETDRGLETIAFTLPGVISVDLRLNEPRYASLPNIMKAKAKPLVSITLDSLALSLKEHQRILAVKVPESRKQGLKVESVSELIVRLRKDGLLP